MDGKFPEFLIVTQKEKKSLGPFAGYVLAAFAILVGILSVVMNNFFFITIATTVLSIIFGDSGIGLFFSMLGIWVLGLVLGGFLLHRTPPRHRLLMGILVTTFLVWWTYFILWPLQYLVF